MYWKYKTFPPVLYSFTILTVFLANINEQRTEQRHISSYSSVERGHGNF